MAKQALFPRGALCRVNEHLSGSAAEDRTSFFFRQQTNKVGILSGELSLHMVISRLNRAAVEKSHQRERESFTKRKRLRRMVFVTNFCPHYRVRTFEILGQKLSVDFLFTSAGDEWYWQRQHGVRVGNFRYEYLPAIRLFGRLRLVPSVLTRLCRREYDVYIKCINGRFVLPITYLVAKFRRKPFVLWSGVWMTLDTPFHRLVFPLTRWIYHHADAIVAYGDHVKRYLISLEVPAEKIFVGHHAMDNALYGQSISQEQKMELRRKLNLGNSRIILYLGRLEAVKGVDHLIEAASEVKEAMG